MYNFNISAQLMCRIFLYFCIIEFFLEWWTLTKRKINSLQMFSDKCSDQLVVFNLISPVKVTQPSFLGGVPSYFEALWYPHLYFYRESNT